MPFKSLAQERYFNANKAKLQKQGVNVNEWNSASKGLKLPKYKSQGVKTKLGNAAGKMFGGVNAK